MPYLPADTPPTVQRSPAQSSSQLATTTPFRSVTGITEPSRLFDGRTHDPEGFSTAPLDSPVLLEFGEPKRIKTLKIQLYDLDRRVYRFTVEAHTEGGWQLVHDRSAEGQGGLVNVDLGGDEVDAFRIVGLYNSDMENNPANRVLHLQEVTVETAE